MFLGHRCARPARKEAHTESEATQMSSAPDEDCAKTVSAWDVPLPDRQEQRYRQDADSCIPDVGSKGTGEDDQALLAVMSASHGLPGSQSRPTTPSSPVTTSG